MDESGAGAQAEPLALDVMKLFAVIRTRGPAWNSAFGLERQIDWAGHARFMDGLQNEGLIVLGGPLEDTADVLLIFRASGPDDRP